jgi:FkbM family methyltransferase
MKKLLQASLQRILGFERYLFLFSWFKIQTLKWDKKEGDFNYFLSLLSEDAHVLDIGANIGIMSGLLAKQCPQGKIFAFEPIPENFRALKHILRFLKANHVECFQIALGTERKEVEMLMPIMQGVQMQGLSHIKHETIEGFDTPQNTYKVQQERLDDLPFWKNGPVHAIKIDVENYEAFVLQGGKALLEKHHPVIYAELWDNENRSLCFELLTGIGYGIFILENNELIPFDAASHQKQNYFFKKV